MHEIKNSNLFPGQHPHEDIHLAFRQHWFVFFQKFLVWLMFILMLVILNFLVRIFFPALITGISGQLLSLLGHVYLIATFLGLFILWIMYYLNLYVVTNERVVDIDQRSLLHHEISEFHISQMQDVTAEIKGIFPTFLDYGHVYIQTAGETERFVFENVPNPIAVEKMLLDLYEKIPPDQKVGLNKQRK